MNHDIEAVLICPNCGGEKAKVYRTPATNEGVFLNATVPPITKGECPDCGGQLIRE